MKHIWSGKALFYANDDYENIEKGIVDQKNIEPDETACSIVLRHVTDYNSSERGGCTSVSLTGGERFMIVIDYREFDNIMKRYYEGINTEITVGGKNNFKFDFPDGS